MPAADRFCPEKYFSGLFNPGERGITLIELLVTLTILGFVITALYTFYLSGLQSWNRSIDRMEYQQSARIAMNKMVSEIRYAHSVEIRLGNNEMLYYWADHKGKLTLFRFRLSGNQLLFEQRRDNDTHYAYNVIAMGISGLSFAIDENDTVFITIRAGEGVKEIIISSSVRPRNSPPRGDPCE